MTPFELLKTWPNRPLPAPEAILRAESMRLPVPWGTHSAVLNFSGPLAPAVFAVKLVADEGEVLLGLSHAVECADLATLAANAETSPAELLLAVFEAETLTLMKALFHSMRQLPQLVEVVPADGELWTNAVPFALRTAEKRELIADGRLVLPPSLVEKYAQIECLSPMDAVLAPQNRLKGLAVLAHMELDTEGVPLEAGDCLVLPEAPKDQYPWNVTVLLESGVALNATYEGDSVIHLQSVIDSNILQSNEYWVALGELSVGYADMTAVLSGESAALPLALAPQVLENGRKLAVGHLAAFHDSTVLEIEK